ncbi:MAG: PAS domain S-box protein [bacterium]
MVDWEESWDKLLAQNLPFRIFLKGRDLTYLACNESYAANHGMKPSEIFGRSDYDLYPRELAEKYRAEDLRILETGLSETIEGRYVKDGQERHGQTIKSLFRDQSGKVIGILGTFWDISELKQAERALQKSEEKYRALVENANEAIIVIQDGALKFANSKASKLLGYSLEEGIGRPFVEFIHPDDRLLAAERYRKRLDGEVAKLVHPFRTIHKDGSIRWAEINSVLISWEDKPAIMSYLSDITERKQAEESLQNERSILRTLIDNIPDSIYSKDLTCRKTLANLTEVRYLGAKSESEVLGKDDFEFYPKEIAEGFFADDQSVMQSGQPVLNKEELVINETGQKRWLLTSKLPLKDESGNITGIVGIGRDITARKQAEEALRESEHRLADIIDFLPDATFAVNKKGEVIAWNHSMEELTGALKEELIGKGDFAYAAPFYGKTGPILIDLIFQDREEMKENYDYLIRREDQVVAEAFVPALRGGKGAYLWGIASPLYDSSGAIVGAIESLRDITEHKRAEEEKRTAEANYRNLFERVPSGLYRSTPEGRFLEVNPAMADLFGYSSVQEMMTLDIGSAFYHSAEERREWVEKLLQAGELRNTENHSLAKDGSSMVLLENSRVVRDESGKVLFFEGTLTDITDRKRAEDALRKGEEKYRLLIENSHDIIYTVTADGVFNFVSPAWTALLGHPLDQVVGKPFQQFVHPDDLAGCRVFRQSVIETGQRQEGLEYRVQHADGTWYWHTSSAIPLKDEAGKIVGFYGIARDITDRKRLEGEMDKTRADFLFGVSHELKTPLFLMDISLEMLENSPESGRAKRTREFMETWKRNLHRLRHLVFNMVDSQRTQTMGFKIERQSTDFRALIEQVVAEQELLAGPKKVRITLDLAPIPPLLIDPEAIHRLVENLLTNAIKFSPRSGEVTIRLTEEEAQAALSVKDQGHGISAEEQKGLFLPFQRAATAVRSVVPGTGLGLYVAKIIVDAHGGTISLRSKVGKGTTVTARLPLGEPGK